MAKEPENTPRLPAHYRLLYTINLQTDRKAALTVNLSSILLMVLLFIAGMVIHSPMELFHSSAGLLIKLAVFLVLLFGYILVHELVHGIFMKWYSGIKPHYGFTGLYAYAGSDVFFNKKSYLVIALAPIVLLGILLGIVNIVVPSDWWWVIYMIQILNISGAAGDIYVFIKFFSLPSTILVQDSGIEMKVYVPDPAKRV